MILEVRNAAKTFGGRTHALAGVSFSLEAGEFVSIIGPSGAGKTTLIRVVNGSVEPDAGEVLIAGEHMDGARGAAKRALQKRLGTIYQDFALVDNMSVLSNVLTAALPDMGALAGTLGLFGAERRAEAAALLARVGLESKVDELVRNLSGGQKQRVAIARALMRHPSLLLADEPMASLDPVTGRSVLALLKEIQAEDGLTVLMNSHNLALAQEFSSRLVGLNAGTVVYDGSVAACGEAELARIYAGAAEELA